MIDQLSPAQRRLLDRLRGGLRTLSGTDLVVARALWRKRPRLARPTSVRHKVVSLNGSRIVEQRWTLTLAGRRLAEGSA